MHLLPCRTPCRCFHRFKFRRSPKPSKSSAKWTWIVSSFSTNQISCKSRMKVPQALVYSDPTEVQELKNIMALGSMLPSTRCPSTEYTLLSNFETCMLYDPKLPDNSERYPNQTNWLVSILGYEIASLLDGKLARWSSTSCVPKEQKSNKNKHVLFFFDKSFLIMLGMRYKINKYSIVWFQIVSDTKYNI